MNLLTKDDREHIAKAVCRNINEMKAYLSEGSGNASIDGKMLESALSRQLDEFSSCYCHWKEKCKEVDKRLKRLLEIRKSFKDIPEYFMDNKFQIFYISAYYKECQKQLAKARKGFKKAMSAWTTFKEEKDRKWNCLKMVKGKDIIHIKINNIEMDWPIENCYIRGDGLTAENVFGKVEEALKHPDCLAKFLGAEWQLRNILKWNSKNPLKYKVVVESVKEVPKKEIFHEFDLAKFEYVKNGYPGAEKCTFDEYAEYIKYNGGPNACKGWKDWMVSCKHSLSELGKKHTGNYWNRFYNDWQKGVTPEMKKEKAKFSKSAEGFVKRDLRFSAKF